MIRLNNDWEFSQSPGDGFLSGGGKAEPVRIPHTVKESPLHYADRSDYEMICGYRRKLDIPAEMQGKRLFCSLTVPHISPKCILTERKYAPTNAATPPFVPR